MRQYFYASIAILLAACTSTTIPSDSNDPSSLPSIKASKSSPAEALRTKIVGEKDWRPDIHQVAKGDTLYSIAFNYGLDYHELATLNGIDDPRKIQIGQVLRLFPTARTPNAPVANNEPKDQPRVVKYEYNNAAMAKIDEVQTTHAKSISLTTSAASAIPEKTYTIPGATVDVLPLAKTAKADSAKNKTSALPPDTPIINTDEDGLQWSMPTMGKIVAGFSEVDNRKGIDIAGKMGQEIFASAPGKVVYSGSGLRGYGKLIILKHNKTFLSAYAHNDKILVKEGQDVKRGEKIAEMGKTDSHDIKLHFEVRRLGKPVDPTKYLPKT